MSCRVRRPVIPRYVAKRGSLRGATTATTIANNASQPFRRVNIAKPPGAYALAAWHRYCESLRRRDVLLGGCMPKRNSFGGQLSLSPAHHRRITRRLQPKFDRVPGKCSQIDPKQAGPAVSNSLDAKSRCNPAQRISHNSRSSENATQYHFVIQAAKSTFTLATAQPNPCNRYNLPNGERYMPSASILLRFFFDGSKSRELTNRKSTADLSIPNARIARDRQRCGCVRRKWGVGARRNGGVWVK